MAASSELCSPYFDFLLDELLVKILQRLPQNFVHRYKCVSKHWLAITLSDDFIRSYIEYHACLPNSKPPFALFYRHSNIFKTSPLRSTFSENPLFKLPGFSFNFLLHNSILLLALNNGLFLGVSASQNLYYVCNPLTKQWVTLPRPPSYNSIIDTGFVCKSTSSGCSFRIVLVVSTSIGSRKLVIYDSESKQWTQNNLGNGFLFEHFYSYRSEAITCNFLLHWKNSKDTIFVYDPYNCPDSYKIVRVPNHKSLGNIKSMIGVCKEHLRYIEWGPENFRVWELEDYDTEKWSLKQEFCINQMETENYTSSNKEFRVLVIHPFDEEIVFLHQENEVIWCNTRLKKLVTVSNMTLAAYFSVTWFPVTLPWWPIAVPPHQRVG